MQRFLAFVFALAVVLCSSMVSAASGPQYLFNRADFPTGNSPSAVAIGDFNNDGRQDVVVANLGDNTVSVLLGQADATLGPKTDFATAGPPIAVSVADFNGDGKADIAVVSGCGQNCGLVSILLANGDGTFGPHVDYATGSGPFGLVVADFNADGIADLAVVDSCGTNCGFVSILLGKGDGSFQPKTDYAVGESPIAVVVQDFNRDGNLDLAVTNNSNSISSLYSISVLLGNGDGTFQPSTAFPVSAGPAGIAAGDLDGDNIPDLAVTHTGAPWALTFMKGNGDGTFQPEQQITTLVDTYDVAAADLNGDGKLDLVLTVVSKGGADVLLGNGDGTFQPDITYATGSYPLAFAVQDLNGDGILDLVVANQNGNTVTTLLGGGNGTFSPITNLPPGPVDISQTYAIASVVGDFNGDGIPDLAIAEGNVDYSTGSVSVLLGKGKGSFQSPISTNANGALGVIAAADFNGDGHLDVAVPNGNGAAVLLGSGTGTFGAPLQVVFTQAIPARSLVIGDFNNDRNPDLVVLGNGFLQTQPIYVLLGKGDGTFQPAKQFWSSTSIPVEVAAGDFNHDGKLDLVVTLNPTGIAVMLGNGDGTFQAAVNYATDNLPGGITVADLNGDGIPDIIAVADQVDVFLGKGDGTFSDAVDYNGGNFPGGVVTADVNADGKLDIVATAEGSAATGALEILLGNGDGTFAPPVEISSGWFGLVSAGDLNQDGTADIITAGNPGALFLSGPMATLSPVSINFGFVGVSSASSPVGVTLANSGNAPLDLTGIGATTNYSATNTCGSSVAIASSCAVNVTFRPTALGNSTGVLTITDNASRGQQKIALSGIGQTDFSLTPTSTSLTLQPGGQQTDVITLASVGGSFASAIQLACAVTGPAPAPTCALSPTSVTPGANPATSTLTVTAPARIAAQPPGRALPPSWLVYALFLPMMFMITARMSNQKLRRYGLFCAFALLFVLQTACGGSNSSGGGGAPPPKNFTVTVTGTSGTTRHTTQVSVSVPQSN